jgi:hypothetical protein
MPSQLIVHSLVVTIALSAASASSAMGASQSVHVQVTIEAALFADIAREDKAAISREVREKAVRSLRESRLKFFNWTTLEPTDTNAARLEIAIVDSVVGDAVLAYRACAQPWPKHCQLTAIAGAPAQPIYKSKDYIPEREPHRIVRKILAELDASLRSDATAERLHEQYLRMVRISDSVLQLRGAFVTVGMGDVSSSPDWQLEVIFGEGGQMHLCKLRPHDADRVEALINYLFYKHRRYDTTKPREIKPVLASLRAPAVMVKCFMNCADPLLFASAP